MAFKQFLSHRFFNMTRIAAPPLKNRRVAAVIGRRETVNNNLTCDPGDDGVFRRFLHSHSATAASSEIGRFFPTGEKLLQKLHGIRIDGLRRPPPLVDEEEGNLTVVDAKKIILLSQLENVKSRLKEIEKGYISHSEFLQICARETSNSDQGFAFANSLDDSGSVIVLGNTVFLRPEQVMEAIEGLIPPPTAHCKQENEDPRLKELQEMEEEKAAIDQKAERQARRELWFGLGCLAAQTAAFMRLTFWELTWDVMEPICFYVTSIYFMAGYAFFLHTSKEPSFEAIFRSRFESKRRRLMKSRNFDSRRYDELKKLACFPHRSTLQRSFSSRVLDESL